MGFNDRKKVRQNPQNPGKITLDWRTMDNCWRYSVRGDDEVMKTVFPDLKARYGDARNLKFIVLEPALYQVTGRNKAGSHRVSSNLCLPGTMDRLVVYRRAIKADDWEVIGKGYYGAIKDEVTNARNGGQWASTVAIWLIEGEFTPYEPEKEVPGKPEKAKINQIAYLTMRGFSSKLGWEKSAAAFGLDGRNCAGVVGSNTESFLQKAEKKSESDKYYPAFTFLQFEEIPKIGEKLREVGNQAYDTLSQFLGEHFDYYNTEEEEKGAPAEEDSEEPGEDDEEAATASRRLTKSEQAVEKRKAELKGKEKVEKITEEDPVESDIPDELPF